MITTILFMGNGHVSYMRWHKIRIFIALFTLKLYNGKRGEENG